MIKFNKFKQLKLLKVRDFTFMTMCRHETTSVVKSSYDKKELWEKKMKFYMKTYEDLFGITKLTEIQEKVIEVQFKLQDIQEKRRKVQEEVFMVQKKLQEMQDILHKTSMGDDMYISIVSQVRELLKEQKRLQDVFSLYDQTEREQQTTLALAINNSQDHERTYREKNKYLSLITGVIGGLLGLLGSSINNWRHKKDIRHFAQDISEQVVDLKHSVEKLKLVASSEGIAINELSTRESEKVLSGILSQQNSLQESVKLLQLTLSDTSNNNFSSVGNGTSNQNFDDTLNAFERNMDSRFKVFTYVNAGLVGSCALCSMLFFVYSGKFG